MSAVSAEEISRRQIIVQSALGTHAMEGLFPDAATQVILRRFESGEITLEQFSESIDSYARSLIDARRTLVGAA